MFQKGQDKDITVLIQNLLKDYVQTIDSMHTIDKIAEKSKMLAINSAIEAARLGKAGAGFSVIAQEIQNFADSNRLANQENKSNIVGLNGEINSIVGVRTADVAFDLIDKIDRNLFERNCDVQAWATFEAVVEYAKEASEELKEKVIGLLHNLYEIYEVYYDIFMTDRDGKIVAAAERTEQIGRNASETAWFQGAKNTEECFVEDMHASELIGAHVVSYSCRIVDQEGTFLGVLSTRFNWNFIYDILDKAKISPKGEIFVINKQGLVIAAKDKRAVLKQDLLQTYPIVKPVLREEEYGYALEMDDQNRLQSVLGYARTKGYNNYAGKGWSVVVVEHMK